MFVIVSIKISQKRLVLPTVFTVFDDSIIPSIEEDYQSRTHCESIENIY